MLLKVDLLFLALFIGKSDAITKPILSLQPPWSTVFSYGKVHLTCGHPDLMGLGDILWYKDGKMFVKTSKNSTVISKSGQYSCGSLESALSDPVNITFFSDWLILQAPYSVFEGDDVTLQCQGWRKAQLSCVTFHKWGKPILSTKENKPLSIRAARMEHGGQYSCSGYLKNEKVNRSSKPVILQVQELFPRPELRIKNSTETKEGSPMALSCKTQLTPQRPASRLFFSFYKDNRTIRDRDQSPEYCIPAAIMTGAGLYWCVAATEDGQVQKQSLSLEIQGSTSLPSVPIWDRRSQLVLGITLALVGMAGITAVLLHYFRLLKKAEGTAVPDPARGHFFPVTAETRKASSSQDPESCPVYVNVSPQNKESEDMVYSVVFSSEEITKGVHRLLATLYSHGPDGAISKDPSPREEDFSVIYSTLALP